MTRLVYPKPEPDRRWSAWWWAVAAVAAVVWVVMAVWVVGWGRAVMLAAIGMFCSWYDQRVQTVVTAEEIAVKGWFRNWTLPVGDLIEVQTRDLAGDPVYAVTRAGRRRQLAKVKPEHLSEIGALTGLPVRDYTDKA
ncbi:hypothetical protein Kisp01_27370 [Kineosporia sp. NBRC 101677]|uniref:hypothetical protein n=1 Tax=Kineosporia sp. NBRC 101677 TaxID=3032197 RepID=UPI0024A0D5BA|nr:hypothetical protein [Kineosporia sp. NBRC 101677]GLY15722.1 hypothetical protein Kisp01_27370 [Kineosporia sp. NBRC 101677]